MIRAGDDAELSDEEKRRQISRAGDDAELSDEEERRQISRAGDDAVVAPPACGGRSDEEERR